MNQDIVDIADELINVHFLGFGCGTNGSNACSNCHGPSPMSAYEIVEFVHKRVIEQLDAGWVLNNASAASVVESIIKRERERLAKAIADAAAAFVAKQDELFDGHKCGRCDLGRENYIRATEHAIGVVKSMTREWDEGEPLEEIIEDVKCMLDGRNCDPRDHTHGR